MKMTLSSPNNTSTTERQPVNLEQRSITPTSSPRGSPRPSPKPQTKREHNKSETHLTVNYKEPSPVAKADSSHSSHDGSISGGLSSNDCTPPSELKGDSLPSSKERKEPRGKKKSSWINSFYPTYKSRSEDFKRIFKEVPDNERLVVDYSCALQKEILVHGRLYVTQNYLCFHANIFGWETSVSLKWKDVTSISKEKTALVIPNAILISTRSDQKFFFTSFLVARDKTYVMLFRVWQNALMDQPMSATEMWQWVHQSYGDELGLTSDDEDYIAPGTEEDKLSARSIESFSENESCITEGLLDSEAMDETEEKPMPPVESKYSDRSDTESDVDKPIKVIKQSTPNEPLPSTSYSTDESGLEMLTKPKKPEIKYKCNAQHAGRQLANAVLPVHIDQLFTLLFTSSKFFLDFHAMRKTTDLIQTPWTHNPLDNSKSRVVSQTVALSAAMGPKTAQVTEHQMMRPCSKAGYLYSIDVETANAGIPYADSFIVLVHYCLKRISDNKCSFSVYAQIKYKKSVWGLVKSMIEKNCWAGLDDFYSSLIKALQEETEENLPEKRKSKRKKRLHSIPSIAEKTRLTVESSGTITVTKSTNSNQVIETEEFTQTVSVISPNIPDITVQEQAVPGRKKAHPSGLFSSDTVTIIVFIVLMVLVFLNVMLYMKLWSLEETPPYTIDLQILQNLPKNHDDWINLLQKQESLHTVEVKKWQKILKNALSLLRQAEESLTELQVSIYPASSKVAALMREDNSVIGNEGEL